MGGDYPIEKFVFEMSVLSSTIRPITVKKLVVTALKHILTPLFRTVDILSLIVLYLFSVDMS